MIVDRSRYVCLLHVITRSLKMHGAASGLLLGMLIAFWPGVVAAQEGPKIVELVTRGMETNRAQLKTAEATYTHQSTKIPGEMVEWTQHVSFSGPELRMDRYSDGKLLESLGFHDGSWWNIFPEYQRYEFYRTEDTSSRVPFDPRDFGMASSKQSALQLIKSGKIISSELVEHAEPASTVAVLLFEQHRTPDESVTLSVEFDGSKNFMPVRVRQYFNDTLTSKIDTTYRECLDKRAWFPEKVLHEFYSVDESTKSKYRTHQKVEQTLTELKVNQDIDMKRFSPVEIPDGFTVVDKIHNKRYFKGKVDEASLNNKNARSRRVIKLP